MSEEVKRPVQGGKRIPKKKVWQDDAPSYDRRLCKTSTFLVRRNQTRPRYGIASLQSRLIIKPIKNAPFPRCVFFVARKTFTSFFSWLSIGRSCHIAIGRFLSRYCFKYMRWRFYGCSVFINDFRAYPLRKAKRNKKPTKKHPFGCLNIVLPKRREFD